MAAEPTQKGMKHSERMKFGLLEAIAKEPAIWDRFDDSFREAKAKAAWNSTKDEYVKQLKKRPSGASAVPCRKPAWRFWDAMSFYAGIAEPRPGHSSTFKPKATDILTQPAGDEDADDDDNENDDDDAYIIELSTTPSSRGPRKKRKLSIDAAEKRLLESIELSDREIKKRLEQKETANVAYGRNVGLSLDRLDPKKAEWAKMHIQSILYQASQVWQPQAQAQFSQLQPINYVDQAGVNKENDHPGYSIEAMHPVAQFHM